MPTPDELIDAARRNALALCLAQVGDVNAMANVEAFRILEEIGDDADSIYAGAFYNIGAFLGTSGMGLLTLRVPPRILTPVLLLLAGVALLVFGNVAMSVNGALAMAFVIGLTLQGGYNGMWPIAAGAFAAETRATGIGWVMGIGRGGAVVGPIMAGYLLAAEVSLPVILAIYCLPLAICALCAFSVHRTAPS